MSKLSRFANPLCVAGSGMLSRTDLGGEPTVYAKVRKEPNPLLLGHWRRIPPAEYNRPDKFEYIMIKKGDKYAVYYYWGHGKSANFHKDWTEFVLEGDSMSSLFDGVKFQVQDGKVYFYYPGRSEGNLMMKLD